MENTIRTFPLAVLLEKIIPKKRPIAAEDKNAKDIIEQMKQLKKQIDEMNVRFDMECDEDLVESYIYQLQALQSRYRYLIKQAKAQQICCGKKEALQKEG